MPAATITVAEADAKMVGFVTVDVSTFDLDQIVVAPEAWGMGVATALMAEAKRISPAGLDLHVNTDNARAIGFYEKHGFVISGEAINWRSGRTGPQDELAAVGPGWSDGAASRAMA